MKRSYIFIGGFLIFILIITIVGSNIVTGNTSIKKEKDILSVQSNKEVYFNGYGYSLDNPNVIINPYGNSPLTGIAMFETSDYSEVSISVNGDINYTFGKNKHHIIPIYGLYADYDNTIVLRSENKEKVINIKTDKLPDDFGDVLYDGNYSFYNGNYPYASDSNGNVRWYLNKKYYGDITVYKDNIIIGNDSYTEDNHSTGIYRMNFLGKVYGEYLLNNVYYGNSIYDDGNIYALSKNIVMIDSQTGTISNLGKNDNYSYINVINGNVIVGKEDKFYSVKDKKFSEVESSEKSNIYSFYDGISEYKIVKGVRYGKLTTTNKYDKDISIIKYDKYDGKDINIKMDVNRISIYNNTGKEVYLILDKLFDKRIYEIKDIKYINLNGLNGKYTIYYKLNLCYYYFVSYSDYPFSSKTYFYVLNCSYF